MRYSKRQTGGGRWKYISFSVLNIPTTPELKSTRITLLFYSVEQTSPARTRLAVCASQSDRPRQERHQASSWRLGSKKQASARLVTHTNHVVTRPLSTTHRLCHLNLGGGEKVVVVTGCNGPPGLGHCASRPAGRWFLLPRSVSSREDCPVANLNVTPASLPTLTVPF